MHSSSTRRAPLAALLMSLVVAVMLTACGSDNSSSSSGASTTLPPIQIQGAWTRPTPAGTDTGAVYFTIIDSDGSDELTSASVPSKIAAAAQLHETTTTGSSSTTEKATDHSGSSTAASDGSSTTEMAGMTGMQQVDKVDVPAGGTVRFEPGGYHVMLTGLVKPLALGQQFDLTLDFTKAGPIEVTVRVQESQDG